MSSDCNVLLCSLFIPICLDSFKQAADTLVKHIKVCAHIPGCIMPSYSGNFPVGQFQGIQHQ